MTQYELHYEKVQHSVGATEIPDEAEHVEVHYQPDTLGTATVCFLLPVD